MADPRVWNGVKYWKCRRCGATFATRDAAMQHSCSGSASIVEIDSEATALAEAQALPPKKK